MLDSSEPVCKISILDGDNTYNDVWQADRTLAKDLLSRLQQMLSRYNKSWSDVTALGVFEGPGSFTGLRIGLTVMNTIAASQSIPIVGAKGDNWREEVISKLNSNLDEKIVIPYYGSEANITTQHK